VSEPDKRTGDEGAIYLWVSEFPGAGQLQEPRAYRLPFTPELQARAMAATTKLRKGLLGNWEKSKRTRRRSDPLMGNEEVKRA
jgi:hypothetical protein